MEKIFAKWKDFDTSEKLLLSIQIIIDVVSIVLIVLSTLGHTKYLPLVWALQCAFVLINALRNKKNGQEIKKDLYIAAAFFTVVIIDIIM